MNLRKNCVLFALGGSGYVALELCWRGRSHSSMFLAGGLSFLAVGEIGSRFPRIPQPLRALAQAGAITAVELGAGLLFNRKHTVWDYRSVPGNFLGQICPVYSLLWAGVAAAAEPVYLWADRKLSQQEMQIPVY